jgi:hypothetical protein
VEAADERSVFFTHCHVCVLVVPHLAFKNVEKINNLNFSHTSVMVQSL